MTDTPGEDVPAPHQDADQDAGTTARPDDEASPDLPGVTAGDTDPVDQDDEEAATAGARADTREVGLGDGDDVQPGAGAVEPPD